MGTVDSLFSSLSIATEDIGIIEISLGSYDELLTSYELPEFWSEGDVSIQCTYDSIGEFKHRDSLKYTYLIPPEFLHLCTLSYFDDFSIFSEEKFSGFREAIVSMSAHAGTIRSH